MKISLILFATAGLFSAAEACKCWAAGKLIPEYTQACCTYTGGLFNIRTNNCDGDIFDKLNKFAGCCRFLKSTSDCDCPTCPDEDERRQALGLPPMTDAERIAFAEKTETGEKVKVDKRMNMDKKMKIDERMKREEKNGARLFIA